MSFADVLLRTGKVLRDDLGVIYNKTWVNDYDMVDDSGVTVEHHYSAPTAANTGVRDTTPPAPLPQENAAPQGVPGQVYNQPFDPPTPFPNFNATTENPKISPLLMVAGAVVLGLFFVLRR